MVSTSGARLICGRAGADGGEGAHDINIKAEAASAGIGGDSLGKSIKFLLQFDIARRKACRLAVGLLQRQLAGLAQVFAIALQRLGRFQLAKRMAPAMGALQRMAEPHCARAGQNKTGSERAESQHAR